MPKAKQPPRRPRGRPVTTGPTPRPAPLPVRLPPDLRAALDAEAARQSRAVTNLIVVALREWLAAKAPR